jgi:hypothetical protein
VEYDHFSTAEPVVISDRFIVQRGADMDVSTIRREPGRETRRAQRRRYLYMRRPDSQAWQADQLSGQVVGLGRERAPGVQAVPVQPVEPGSLYARLLAQQLLPPSDGLSVEGSSGDALERVHAAAGVGPMQPFDGGRLGYVEPVTTTDGWAW